MNFLRAFLAFMLNAVVLTLAFFVIPWMFLGVGNVFVVLFLSMLMTWLTWVIWDYGIRRTDVTKQKRGQSGADIVDLQARLARLETIAAAEHLSDYPEDWDQIDIKRKRGMS